MGFGLGFKRYSRSQPSKTKADEEEQWYIPYTGTYEPPRQPTPRLRPRDSWGDPLDADGDDDAVLADKELRERFREYGDTSSPQSSKFPDEDRKTQGRDRAFSLMSGRTVSSGAVDPNRSSTNSPRRSTITSGQRPPVPSYIHLDATGGVGESPAPHVHGKETSLSNRLSLASIFSFGSSNRKAAPSSGQSPQHTRKLSLRKPRPSQLQETRPAESKGRPSVSSESPTSPLKTESKPLVLPTDRSKTNEIAPDDYYNSYYSTLIPTPAQEKTQESADVPSIPGRPSTSTLSRQESMSSNAAHTHPYAYISSKPTIQDPPLTAPASSTMPKGSPSGSNGNSPRPAFINPNGRTLGLGLKQLKNSASTPDLRNSIVSGAKLYSRPSMNFKDRWLSAETWCDAILFPRPRFKVKEKIVTSNGRIISPPATPIEEEKVSEQGPYKAVPSRVLAHSRSLVNLNAQRAPASAQPEVAPQSTLQLPPIVVTSTSGRPPRPKSFAADDLALINPAFSLEKVIEEGEELEYERKKWQLQATSSIGNSRARSLARTRSKSLTHKGRKVGQNHQTTMDYLAARACLGSQNVAADILVPRSRTSSATNPTQSFTTNDRISHSHSNSLTKSFAKSSNTHSRGHSRSESWSKSIMKHIHPPAGHVVETDNKGVLSSTLEGALRRDDTRIIRFPDPAYIPVDNLTPPRISPTPSGSNEIHMGIAISTPPPPDDPLDRESIRMPAHPYASGGLYTRGNNIADPQETVKRPLRTGADYAGPHPIEKPLNNKASLPSMSLHPYARAISPDAGFITQSREDSSVPLEEKMWAQLSPGIVREVLPDDLKYSPFLPEHETQPKPSGSANGHANYGPDDSVGLGEALTYDGSLRASPDSGLGTSESHVVHPYVTSSSPDNWEEAVVSQVRRKPVQYDTSVIRPVRPTLAQYHDPTPSNEPIAVMSVVPSSDLLPTAPTVQESTPTSGTPSPQNSPRSLGSPNDLESFHDLFYKPNSIRQTSLELVAERPMSDAISLTWEMASRGRSGSGLTSLARQLSQEFEQLEKDRSSSQYSFSSFAGTRHDSQVRKMNESGGLQFVFEESRSRTESPIPDGLESDHDNTVLVKPAFDGVPEDVASFGHGSVLDRTMEDEDETAVFRVGAVEPIATPPAENPDRRQSLTGLMSYDHRFPRDPHESHLSTLSGLRPPDQMRSSYMTTSTSSRMSGLSDFPAPPKDGAAGHHMSLLAAYFDNSSNHRESQARHDTPHPLSPDGNRTTFGDAFIDSPIDSAHPVHSHQPSNS